MGISRQTASKRWGRFVREGTHGLADRSSRPRHSPGRTHPEREAQILGLRAERKLGPARIGGILGIPAATVHRVLVGHGINRLRWMDRPTGRVIRRIETSRPGELIHIDVKKLARIPDGGGHKMLGRTVGKPRQAQRAGYTHIHSAIDAYSRLACSEFAAPESAISCTGFLERATRFFADHGISTERILTDNGVGYRSNLWANTCADRGIAHTRTRPYRPATNGKESSATTAPCSTRCFYVCQVTTTGELPSKKRNNCRATARLRQRLISRADRPSAWRRAT